MHPKKKEYRPPAWIFQFKMMRAMTIFYPGLRPNLNSYDPSDSLQALLIEWDYFFVSFFDEGVQ